MLYYQHIKAKIEVKVENSVNMEEYPSGLRELSTKQPDFKQSREFESLLFRFLKK
jgi:hypothetical protein